MHQRVLWATILKTRSLCIDYMLLKLTRLLDHLLGNLLERSLILINDLQDVKIRVVLVAHIPENVLGVTYFILLVSRVKRSVQKLIIATQ